VENWDVRESPFDGAAPKAGGYIDLSYSAGLDPSGGSTTPAPPLASSSRLNLAISDSYLTVSQYFTSSPTLVESSDERFPVHIMIA